MIRNSTTQSVLITFVLFIIGAVISKSMDILKISDILYAATFVVTTLLVISLAMGHHVRRIERGVERHLGGIGISVRKLEEDFKAVTAAFRAEWLVTKHRLISHEKENEFLEIWVITSSLEEEAGSDLLPVISANIARGIRYKYIVPSDSILRGRAQRLKDSLGNPSNLHFEFIDDPFFRIICMQDVAIYFYSSHARKSPQSFMNLPIREHGLDFFLELGDEQTEKVISYLNEYFSSRHVVRPARGPVGRIGS